MPNTQMAAMRIISNNKRNSTAQDATIRTIISIRCSRRRRHRPPPRHNWARVRINASRAIRTTREDECRIRSIESLSMSRPVTSRCRLRFLLWITPSLPPPVVIATVLRCLVVAVLIMRIRSTLRYTEIYFLSQN